jgi:hypothetical protein
VTDKRLARPSITRARHVRRRRLTAVAVLGATALAALAVVLWVTPSSRHVTVVRVVTAPKPSVQTLPSASGGRPQSPHAPSDAAIRAELKAAEGADTGGTGVSEGNGVLEAGANASFDQFARTLPNRIQIALLPLGGGRVQTLGGDIASHGWSTTKVPVLAALIKARGSRGLTSAERSSAVAAITASDNGSILSLFGDLERMKGGLIGASNYVQSLFRQSGDQRTIVATASPPAGAVTTFGQTEWSPAASATFMSALGRGCLLSSTQTDYVLGLMQNIEPGESWGLGSAGFRAVAFKGGWGPESGGYLVRQAGIINVGSPRAVAVAIVALPPGSFASGTEALTRTAMWLRRHLRTASTTSDVPCST